LRVLSGAAGSFLAPVSLSCWCCVLVSVACVLESPIGILSRAFAKVVFSDAFDAKAGFSLGRFGTALFSCILCVCWVCLICFYYWKQ